MPAQMLVREHPLARLSTLDGPTPSLYFPMQLTRSNLAGPHSSFDSSPQSWFVLMPNHEYGPARCRYSGLGTNRQNDRATRFRLLHSPKQSTGKHQLIDAITRHFIPAPKYSFQSHHQSETTDHSGRKAMPIGGRTWHHHGSGCADAPGIIPLSICDVNAYFYAGNCQTNLD